jgi:hypothetical protein
MRVEACIKARLSYGYAWLHSHWSTSQEEGIRNNRITFLINPCICVAPTNSDCMWRRDLLLSRSTVGVRAHFLASQGGLTNDNAYQTRYKQCSKLTLTVRSGNSLHCRHARITWDQAPSPACWYWVEMRIEPPGRSCYHLPRISVSPSGWSVTYVVNLVTDWSHTADFWYIRPSSLCVDPGQLCLPWMRHPLMNFENMQHVRAVGTDVLTITA